MDQVLLELIILLFLLRNINALYHEMVLYLFKFLQNLLNFVLCNCVIFYLLLQSFPFL